MIAIVLYGFAGYHIWLVTQNTTTNETYKWTDYVRYIKFYRTKFPDELPIPPNSPSTSSSTQSESKTSDKDQKKGKETQEIKKRKNKSNSSEEEELIPPKYKLNSKGTIIVKNIYRKGLYGNFWEILSPPSTRVTSNKNNWFMTM